MAAEVTNPPENGEAAGESRPQRRRFGFGWVVAVCLGIAALVLIYTFPDGASPKAGRLSAHSAEKQPVEVEADIDQSVLVEQGSPITLHVTVTNQSVKTISNPYLGIFAPGFDPGSQPSQCQESGQAVRSGLEVGSSCTFTVQLRSLPQSGTYWITPTVGWGTGASDRVSVRLGPVLLDGEFGAVRWARFGHRIEEILKDLTLPLLLLFLTNYYTGKQKEREEDAAKAQERRTQRQQIRQLLLNQVMENAQKHYMPMMACSVLVLRELEKLEKKEVDASLNRLLFQILTLVRLLDSFRRERGGFFLKRIEAEKLVGFSWQVLKETLFTVLTEEQVDLAVSKSKWLDNYSEFRNHLDDFEVAQRRMNHWFEVGEPKDEGEGRERGRFSEYAGVIDIMQAVLRHEVNHILMGDWYDEEKVPDVWSFIRESTELPSTGKLTATQLDRINFINGHLTAFCGRPIQAAQPIQ